MISVGTQTDCLCTCLENEKSELERKQWKKNLLTRYNQNSQIDEHFEKSSEPTRKNMKSS